MQELIIRGPFRFERAFLAAIVFPALTGGFLFLLTLQQRKKMTIHFKIFCNPSSQSAPLLRIQAVAEQLTEITLNNTTEGIWEAEIADDAFTAHKKIKYTVQINPGNIDQETFHGSLNLKKYKAEKLNVLHEITPGKNVRIKLNFIDIGSEQKLRAAKSSKQPTHIFKVTVPHLQSGKYLCLTGSAKKMNEWNSEKPLVFKRKKGKAILALDLSGEIFPAEYKLAIYDAREKKIIAYETGENRNTERTGEKEISIIDLAFSFEQYLWKAAGVNVPVSALRSSNSWGTGEFTDLKLLADWASDTGIKMIQLLPVNDTTAMHTYRDAYPYSPISSIALHPQFLNVQQLAKKAGYEFSDEQAAEGKRLNALPFIDQPAVMRFKIELLKELFQKLKEDLKSSKKIIRFFEKNKDWLGPYAAFCYLRDKYNDITKESWGHYATYNNEAVDELISPANAAHEEIQFWYFIQFQLHLQLKNAVKYAHKKEIILKADLPIGMDRHSVDTWTQPELFDLTMQAGAPPDAFTAAGQNWSFPTYNWEHMKADNFSWFKKRLRYPQKYFDALRIDHVLGLFRIWSIPANQIQGILGRFVPMIPITGKELTDAGIDFTEARFCEPYITDEILRSKFGDDTEAVRNIFFSGNKLSEAFSDQRKIAAYFDNNPDLKKDWKNALLEIIADVIFLKTPAKNIYDFRINMEKTDSYKALPVTDQVALSKLYKDYFFERQNKLWEEAGVKKLRMMKDSTAMLLCAEDLGMVPDFTEKVLRSMHILSLEVQQMGKKAGTEFSDISKANYEAVVMPGTHDMATIREWWESRRDRAQYFFTRILHEKGAAPYFCEPWICKKIIDMHLQSPAMWSIFLLQDLLAMSGDLRRANPFDERINDPAFDDHVWKYRMHLPLENLRFSTSFTAELRQMIKDSNR